MQSIQRLIEEHDLMDDMAYDLMELVQSPEPQAIEAFTMMRRLAACMDEHVKGEEGVLYTDHYRAMPNRLEKEVVAFERNYQDLTEEWTIYMSEWSIENIAIDWRNFDHATQWVMGRFRARLEQENEILYPLALHYSRIRLRDPETVETISGFTACGPNI